MKTLTMIGTQNGGGLFLAAIGIGLFALVGFGTWLVLMTTL